MLLRCREGQSGAVDLPDTSASAEFPGRPGTCRGQGWSAYPQARAAALVECGTHAVFAAHVAPLTVHETALAQELFASLTPGMLLLGDRGFRGLDLWRAATATGADLLWRAKSDAVLPVLAVTEDGSYLSQIFAARNKNRRADPTRVRVIDYTLGRTDRDTTVYRLVTSILGIRWGTRSGCRRTRRRPCGCGPFGRDGSGARWLNSWV
ncbi:transposase [Kitasatospora sp. GP82]|uniref:transposase n=1 Tax=Kitasatospora sp. GP82 TaxID=3035089 RepID=UPI002474626D|nr:transposase [Kitasatospora sp. GP82]MDH6127472.1 hypothetical protein [Kitasatospora sp. GP82]